ncbi:hypothetical protein PWT90_05406 [Aphanocladium album]|nr:hypothetical protein PWT90_05406 [Aphanocladium album]
MAGPRAASAARSGPVWNLQPTWKHTYGSSLTERLVPVQLFVLGGNYDFDNVVVKDAAEALRIRGPIAQQISQLPDGAQVTLTTG